MDYALRYNSSEYLKSSFRVDLKYNIFLVPASGKMGGEMLNPAGFPNGTGPKTGKIMSQNCGMGVTLFYLKN